MATDKVLLEVLNNRFTGIVEEMGYIIHRASFTVFIKETWDFDSALVSTDGEIFCYPRNIGVTNMLGMRMDDAIRAVGDVEPGDVIVTNDPHRTRGMCTHLPDIMMFKPLFAGGRLLCFAWCFIHSSDVGGLVPGPGDQASDALLQAAEAAAREALRGGPAEELPHVAAWREAYRAFGAKPKRTRNSLEALLRRAASGLPRVNRLTDCYNAGLGAAPDPARRGGPDPLRRPAAAGPRRRRRAVRHGG